MARNESAAAQFARAHSTRFTPTQRETLKRKLMSFRSASSGVPSSAPVAKASTRPATERLEPSQARPSSKPSAAPTVPKAKVALRPNQDRDRAAVTDVRQFRWMSHRDKNLKLLELARSALRKPHPGLRDRNDVTKWAIAPGSRKFTGHSERFRDDMEYRQLLVESGCVDSDGKLARWTKDAQGKDCYKDFEAVVAQENEGGASKGEGRGLSSAPSSASSNSWSSSSWNWRGSSWSEHRSHRRW